MDILKSEAARLGRHLTAEQVSAFELYYHELVMWNERVNLTSITGYEAVQVKHFLDSLTCLLAFPQALSLRVLDVGSGAGFPGLPIRIVRPDIRLALLESVAKKVLFLQHIVAALGLNDVNVLHGRAEEMARRGEEREQYDVVVARAVAELNVLAELALPFCRVGGLFIAQKRADIGDEMRNAARAIATLGGVVQECLPVDLPGVEARQLVVVKKVHQTDARYPRRPGIPEKRPLV